MWHKVMQRNVTLLKVLCFLTNPSGYANFVGLYCYWTSPVTINTATRSHNNKHEY